jgi:hypothetical protein
MKSFVIITEEHFEMKAPSLESAVDYFRMYAPTPTHVVRTVVCEDTGEEKEF